MSARRRRIIRQFSRQGARDEKDLKSERTDAPRTLSRTVINFASPGLSRSLSEALADAFWSQVKTRSNVTRYTYWFHLKVFGRFVQQSQAVLGLRDVGRELLGKLCTGGCASGK